VSTGIAWGSTQSLEVMSKKSNGAAAHSSAVVLLHAAMLIDGGSPIDLRESLRVVVAATCAIRQVRCRQTRDRRKIQMPLRPLSNRCQMPWPSQCACQGRQYYSRVDPGISMSQAAQVEASVLSLVRCLSSFSRDLISPSGPIS
jgi:hypothetical protein